MPEFRQVQSGAGVPRPLPLRWALAGQTAGGQNHLPTVSNTINSEPTNIDRLYIVILTGPPESCGPDGALLRLNLQTISAILPFVIDPGL